MWSEKINTNGTGLSTDRPLGEHSGSDLQADIRIDKNNFYDIILRQQETRLTLGPCRSSLAPWRPWTLTPRDAELTTSGSPLEPTGDQQASGSKGAFGFQHPVRLYLPISKRQEYLQSSGEKVLASFPVQATIHFYNDASDSEEEEEEESQASNLQCQDAEQAESGPGAEGRERLTPPGRGSGGLGGKGPLTHSHCPGSAESSSSK